MDLACVEGWEDYDPRRIVPGCIIASISEAGFYTSFVIEIRQIEETAENYTVRTISICSNTQQPAYFYYNEENVAGCIFRMLIPEDGR